MSGETVDLRWHLDAPPDRVFGAFADAHLISRWLSPSPDIVLTVLRFEFRVAGAYRFSYRLPDGADVVISGVYRKIERPRQIVFSWIIEPPDEHAGLESEVTVTIAAQGSGTDLHIRHEKLDRRGAAPRHHAGWRGAIERLTLLLRGPQGAGETSAKSDESERNGK